MAVEELGVRSDLVLDQTQLAITPIRNWRAVKAAVASFPSHEFEFVRLLFGAVKAARRIVAQGGGNPNDPNQVVPVATEQNVILEVEALRKSPFFNKMVAAGTLLIAGGVYDLATQRVNILIQ